MPQTLIQQFKRHNYKMTPQRRAIIEIIAGCTSQHPTAEQIHERVAEQMPDVSLATVYNTLAKLVEMRQVYELNLGQTTRRYELSRDEHAHLVCLTCGEVEDVSADFGRLRSLFSLRNGFRATRYDVTVLGYCSSCAQG